MNSTCSFTSDGYSMDRKATNVIVDYENPKMVII